MKMMGCKERKHRRITLSRTKKKGDTRSDSGLEDQGSDHSKNGKTSIGCQTQQFDLPKPPLPQPPSPQEADDVGIY